MPLAREAGGGSGGDGCDGDEGVAGGDALREVEVAHEGGDEEDGAAYTAERA